MADFSVNATQLSAPQGQGTEPVAPVQEKVSDTSILPLFKDIGQIFVKGLEQDRKDEAEKRKQAVIGEYLGNEKVYTDALTTGQWGSAQTSTASRANFQKMLAAYPMYADELVKARNAQYVGTETGEAEKRVEEQRKQRSSDISAASNMGYTFYMGMSPDAEDKNIEAYKTARRAEIQTEKDMKAAAEARAVAAEGRATGQYNMTVEDHVAKNNAVKGLTEVAAANFDAMVATADDLKAKMGQGLTHDQALAIQNGNIARVRAALLSISGRNPELAAPWSKLFDDMDSNIRARLDPKQKSADETALLEDQWKQLIITQKLAAVNSNPALLKAVVGTNLFPGEGMVSVANTPVVTNWILSGTGADPALPPPPQIIGTQDDGKMFKATKDAINRLQSGKVPPAQRDKAIQEAVNLVNLSLKQTASVDGALNASALKNASTFYASPEFGKLAMEGKIDKQTAANAQQVFQVQYEPAVRSAILSKLDEEAAYQPTNGDPAKKVKLADTVELKVVGNNVVFETKNPAKPATILGIELPGNTLDMEKQYRNKKPLDDAAAGLNQLIRLHAHLEGTTDYAAYWEKNKSQLMPNIFPDPKKYPVGVVINGKKYLGGNYRNPANWEDDGGKRK